MTSKANIQSFNFTQQRLSLLESLAKGERAILDKKTKTNAQAKKQMAKWLKPTGDQASRKRI